MTFRTSYWEYQETQEQEEGLIWKILGLNPFCRLASLLHTHRGQTQHQSKKTIIIGTVLLLVFCGQMMLLLPNLGTIKEYKRTFRKLEMERLKTFVKGSVHDGVKNIRFNFSAPFKLDGVEYELVDARNNEFQKSPSYKGLPFVPYMRYQHGFTNDLSSRRANRWSNRDMCGCHFNCVKQFKNKLTTYFPLKERCMYQNPSKQYLRSFKKCHGKRSQFIKWFNRPFFVTMYAKTGCIENEGLLLDFDKKWNRMIFYFKKICGLYRYIDDVHLLMQVKNREFNSDFKAGLFSINKSDFFKDTWVDIIPSGHGAGIFRGMNLNSNSSKPVYFCSIEKGLPRNKRVGLYYTMTLTANMVIEPLPMLKEIMAKFGLVKRRMLYTYNFDFDSYARPTKFSPYIFTQPKNNRLKYYYYQSYISVGKNLNLNQMALIEYKVYGFAQLFAKIGGFWAIFTSFAIFLNSLQTDHFMEEEARAVLRIIGIENPSKAQVDKIKADMVGHASYVGIERISQRLEAIEKKKN